MISIFSLIVASKLPCRATGGKMHPWCGTLNVNNALLRWTPAVGAERWEHWLALVHRWCVGVLLRCCTGAHALQQLVFQHSCKVRAFSFQRAALVYTVWRVWSRSGACRKPPPPHTHKIDSYPYNMLWSKCEGTAWHMRFHDNFKMFVGFFLLLGCAVSHDAEESNFPQIPLSGRLPLLR